MNATKYLTVGFALALSVFVLLGATNVRTLGNSDNGRYEFYLKSSGANYDYLLDTQTGDMWRVGKDKIPVNLK